MKSLGYKSKNYKSTSAIYNGISLMGRIWGGHLKKMITLFYLVFLFELILCAPCFAMFQGFFTQEEIETAGQSRQPEIRRIQEALASQNPQLSQQAAEEIINAFILRHKNPEEAELEMKRNPALQNQRIRRVFEMLNHYDQNAPNRHSKARILDASEVFLANNSFTIEEYTLENFFLSVSWYLRLIRDSTSSSPTPGYLFDRSNQFKVDHLLEYTTRAGRILDDLQRGKAASISGDPFFLDAICVVLGLLRDLGFYREYEGLFYPQKFTEELTYLRNLGLSINTIFITLTNPELVESIGGDDRHALLIERLVPFCKRDNYVDYIMINACRLKFARRKLARDEEGGLRFILDILEEQGVRFPIKSQGITEIRPPIDMWCSILARDIFREKCFQELRRLLSQPKDVRDFKVLHSLKDRMDLYEAYINQALEEGVPNLIELEVKRRRMKNAEESRIQNNEAQQNRRGSDTQEQKKPKGKRAPVIQELPKQDRNINYNYANKYK